jgi:hypothetical protein
MKNRRHIFGVAVAMMVVAGGLPAQDKPGQENAAPAKNEAADIQVNPAVVRRVDDYVQFQMSLPNQAFGTNLKYQGVVPMAWRAPNPLHLINPLAPLSYGDGHQNVIVDPATKQQQGVKLIQVRF